MKKVTAVLGALLMVVLSVAPLSRAYAATGPNLVANPSAETATVAGQPDSWSKGGWGTNTATLTQVTTDGHTGSASLKTEITSYTNGDAKWYAAPVAVTAGQTYTYSDWYKSSVSSDLIVEYQTAAGAYSYAWLATTPASATWKQASINLTVPANIAKASVFHLIASVGFVQIDDVSLAAFTADPTPTPTPTPVPTTGNLIANPSFETASSSNPNIPANWSGDAWGTNTTTFSYLNTGQEGTHSAKVQMTARTNGDAKWNFGNVPVNGGVNYQFTDYYQSNVVTDVDIAVTMSDGSVQWFWLGSAQPTTGTAWQQFKAQFSAPAGAVNASVMHILYSVGTLTTDNYTFAPYTPSGFNRALITLTFDDAWRSIYTNGLPELNKYGFKSTQYLLTGVTSDPDYMTAAMMKAFYTGGHEIASHTVTHPHLPTLSATKLKNELLNSKNWLTTNIGVTPTNFATPYGEYNTTVLNAIKQYYSSHRGVESGYNSKDNFDIWDIKVQNITSDTTAAQVAAWVAQAQQSKTWLVLVYHEIGANLGGDIYHTDLPTFDAQLNAIKQSGIVVVTLQQAINEIKPQL
jgi:peptidoglycan/xylan/chitin deacetylase (PgdA/CDA1 family)